MSSRYEVTVTAIEKTSVMGRDLEQGYTFTIGATHEDEAQAYVSVWRQNPLLGDFTITKRTVSTERVPLRGED